MGKVKIIFNVFKEGHLQKNPQLNIMLGDQEQKYPLSPLLFSMVLEFWRGEIRKGTEIKEQGLEK